MANDYVDIIDLDGEQWDMKDTPLNEKVERIEIDWKDIFPTGNVSNVTVGKVYYLLGMVFIISSVLTQNSQTIGNGNVIGTHNLEPPYSSYPIRFITSSDLGNSTRAGVALDFLENGEIKTYLLGSSSVSLQVNNSRLYVVNWTIPVEWLKQSVRDKYGI